MLPNLQEQTLVGTRHQTQAKVLRAEGLCKHYKKRSVLNHVSLSLTQGQIIGLLGPNGAGKTTCFYMITGLIAPDQGTIYLNDKDVTELPLYARARLGIGYLPQESSIFKGMSTEDNIAAILEITSKTPKQQKDRLEELLEEFSLIHVRHTPSIALSGGERRRLEIARALASDPLFLLLDEPFAGVDPVAVEDIRQLITSLKQKGIGILLTDHNVQETLDVIDKGYILHNGTILMEGTKEDILANEQVRKLYLGQREYT